MIPRQAVAQVVVEFLPAAALSTVWYDAFQATYDFKQEGENA